MANKINYDSDNLYHKLIGEILLEADLISQAQLEMALAEQNNFFLLKLGEIMVLRGWLKQETVDFLVEKVLNPQQNYFADSSQRIGEYFQQAGLLTNEQIDLILQEQKKLGKKFGYLAILKGFLQEKTLTFFLEKVLDKREINRLSKTIIDLEEEQETLVYSPQDVATNNSASMDTLDSRVTKLLDDCEEEETLIFRSDTEEALIEEIVITPTQTIKINSQETKIIYCNNVAYSPICINY